MGLGALQQRHLHQTASLIETQTRHSHRLLLLLGERVELLRGHQAERPMSRAGPEEIEIICLRSGNENVGLIWEHYSLLSCNILQNKAFFFNSHSA